MLECGKRLAVYESPIIGRNSKYERRTADVDRDCENEIIVISRA